MIVGARRLSLVTVVKDQEPDDMPRYSKQVNDYLFLQKLGKGSYGKVYLAVNTTTKQKYAIKKITLRELIHASAGVAQLEREIRLMRSLHHPNILKLHEVLFLEKTRIVYLVLEYAENGSLGKYIERKISIPLDATFSVIKQITESLVYIHSKGFVHQDIKPWNILMRQDGRALLADFGIGHSFQSACMVVGTPAFQAPEALADEGDAEARPQEEDVWALGITLYQLLFLKLPFIGDNLYEIVCDIKNRPVEIPEDTDPEIVALLRGMLQVDPQLRMKMKEVREHPLIANAPDLAQNLPHMPPIEKDEKDINPEYIVHESARICDESYSFSMAVDGSKQFKPKASLLVPGSSGSWGTSYDSDCSSSE